MRKRTNFLIFFLLPIVAYGQLPFAFSKRVQKMPLTFEIPTAQTTAFDASKKGGDFPWIVFSDRAENVTYTTPGGTLVMKKLGFMEPFFVSETKDGYVKLLKYNVGMVRGRKIVDRSTAISYGWIAQDKLLLWQRAYTNSKTGYAEKALIVIHGKSPLTQARSFFDENDSVYVYSTPNRKKQLTKLRLGQVVYIYKTSVDGKKLLIGRDEQLFPDEARENMIGWVDREIVAPWGDRLFLSPRKTVSEGVDTIIAAAINQSLQNSSGHYFLDPVSESDHPLFRSYPLLNQDENSIEIALLRDVYDRNENAVMTLNGTSLFYWQYSKLRKSLRNMNVIFVVDGGAGMGRYFAGLVNTLQRAQAVFQEYGQANHFRYGAIVYRNPLSSCQKASLRSFPLNANYGTMLDSLKEEIPRMAACAYNESAQPLGEALHEATTMFQGKEDETNLIVVLGSTGDDHLKQQDISSLSEKIAKRGVNLLAIQLYSRKGNLFNDFIVQSRQLIFKSAVMVATKKRATMVNGEALQTEQRFDMRLADSNSFYLDYPKNSLVTGGVVYPSLGEVKSTGLVIGSLARFIADNVQDVHNHINTLDSAFRLEGTAREKLNPAVVRDLEGVLLDSVAAMPHNLYQFYSKAHLNRNIWAQYTDLFEFTLILSASEYGQLYDDFLLMKGENLQLDNRKFRSRLYRNYLHIAKKRLLLKLPPKAVKKMTLGAYFTAVSGLPVDNDLWCTYSVKDIKDNMPQEAFESYLNALIRGGDRVKTRMESDLHFSSNGRTYYVMKQSDIAFSAVDLTIEGVNK